TVWPTFTVTDFGENWMFFIETVVPPPPPPEAGVVEDDVLDFLEPPQPASSAAARRRAARERTMPRSVPPPRLQWTHVRPLQVGIDQAQEGGRRRPPGRPVHEA